MKPIVYIILIAFIALFAVAGLYAYCQSTESGQHGVFRRSGVDGTSGSAADWRVQMKDNAGKIYVLHIVPRQSEWRITPPSGPELTVDRIAINGQVYRDLSRTAIQTGDQLTVKVGELVLTA